MELAHPVEVAELSLEVDASSTHVGAVLHQHTGSVKRPLGFFSVKLNQHSRNTLLLTTSCWPAIWAFVISVR